MRIIFFTHFLFQILLAHHVINIVSFLIFDGGFLNFYFSFNIVMIRIF